jgi:hypothetical protein
MKLDKSQVLLSPEDEDLRQGKFYFWQGYPTISFGQNIKKNMHKIIGERIGFVSKRGSGFLIDHINRNKLDNRRENLRLVSYSVNANNCEKVINSKGYRWVSACKKYKSQIKIRQKSISLGYFNSPEEARKAYVEAKNKYLIELGLTDILIKE